MSTLRHCEHCGHWLRRGTVAEALHGPRCRKAPKREPLRQRWREALRAKLAEDRALFPIIVRARLKIHPDQLRRVAEGKSDFALSTWRRLERFLDLPSP